MAEEAVGTVLSGLLLLPADVRLVVPAILCIELVHVRSEYDSRICRNMKKIKRTFKQDVPPGRNNYGI